MPSAMGGPLEPPPPLEPLLQAPKIVTPAAAAAPLKNSRRVTGRMVQLLSLITYTKSRGPFHFPKRRPERCPVGPVLLEGRCTVYRGDSRAA